MGPMAMFWVCASVLVLVVLGLLLRPLLRESRGIAAAFAVGIAVAALSLYFVVGTPAALKPQAAVAMPETLDDAIKQMRAELAKNPNQPEGWRLLGQALSNTQRPAEARDAFAHAAKLAPQEPDVLVEAAQARALAEPDRTFDAQAIALLQQALQVQPQHQRARWFLGIAQRQAGQNAEAARTWEPLLAVVDPSTMASLRTQINAAREAGGEAPLPAATPTVNAPNAPGLRVRVALDPDFASRVRLRGDATVFVIARAAGGPPMPVAVERHTLQDLPLDIVLDDADSPMPTQKLSALREVEVLARISTSGEAIPQEGDIASTPVKVTLPAKAPVDLTLGSATP
jgi:cytochrome c-type biogenesis protein CcmH